MSVTILIPVYNDWGACAILLRELDRELKSRRHSASVLLVDDGSSEPPEESGLSAEAQYAAVSGVEILHLRHNLGHQRAIAIGLAFLENRGDAEITVVMDGDGEDLASDVGRLLEALEEAPDRIVFAERRRRSEGVAFTALYHLYRGLHLILTGESVRVGNFSAIPRSQLRRLVGASDLWNNYSAAVFHARLSVTLVPTHRGKRHLGRSKMDFVAMVVHGLSAMSVYGDRIGVRLLFGAAAITLATIGALSFALFSVWIQEVAWLTVSLFALAVVLILFVTLISALGFVFVILAGRGNAGFLPFRDYGAYISHLSSLRDTHVTDDRGEGRCTL
jgi:glycosyltransferase involved in cell wall biosynthesis